MKCKGFIWTVVLTLYVSLAWAQATQDTICILEPPSNLAVPYQAGLVYQWSVGGGKIISKPDSNVIKVDWSAANAGQLMAWVTAIDTLTGCPGDTSYASLLISHPHKAIPPPAIEVCEGDEAVLESIILSDYSWQDGSTDRYFTFKPVEDTSVYLVAFNGKCDNDTIFYQVHFQPAPEGGISPLPDTVYLQSTHNVLYNRLGTAQTQVEWFLNGYSEGLGRAINLHFTQGGWNQLAQLVSEGACTDTLWKDIYVNDEYTAHFPNTFTPNGDGINDYWTFGGVGHRSFVAEIYNRWGEMVFTWTNTDQIPGWDGTTGNETSPQATYVYVVRIIDRQGKEHVYRNHVNLLR